MRRSGAERFWAKVDRSDGDAGCWWWLGGGTTSGHGMFSHNYRSVPAHRFAYALTFGAIPAGLVICHHCDNPRCVNPAHLFLGTYADNMQDKLKKGLHHTRPGTSRMFEKLQALESEVARRRESRRLDGS